LNKFLQRPGAGVTVIRRTVPFTSRSGEVPVQHFRSTVVAYALHFLQNILNNFAP
jgi:hypothetical protein